ncbi:sensor histidine kinase [Salinisphaera hydrothermalis]|uniref:Sensory transduction protein kinase AlgZ n=1 Tax=Salinisphaera hydrothermalis (strain C41B8) TaxID=1304275 RepID=A0A084IN22_SALHC|nr:histidine kinase [Salinisphaera hydrothermalis]KEZ78106.1 sensory transduction protein kinase AlgZ [Salinisphaera hydrothermalis C41B8]
MSEPEQPTAILPDFCTGSRVVRVLIVCEAVAIVLALGSSMSGDLWRRLFLLSVYLQWIGVCSAAALCLIRRHAGRMSTRTVVGLSYLCLLLVTLAVTEIIFVAGRFTGFGLIIEHSSQEIFLARSLGICAVVAALALRYFWLRASWAVHAEAELRARLEALQARIEPHFLFNTLNSVAALIEHRPAEAETALEDLATLLRARLKAETPTAIRLVDEMRLVEAYVRIEQLRLGDRLAMEVDLSPAAREGRLPSLCLQPLVENAIGHGVARLPDGGTVRVRAWIADGMLFAEVRNPVASAAERAPGHRQALSNIRRRLALAYEGRARLDFTQDATWFTVRLAVPQQDREDAPP